MGVHLRSPMDEGHTSAMPPEIERRYGGRVLAPDDEHVVIEVRMRLAIIMKNLRQVFSWNAQ